MLFQILIAVGLVYIGWILLTDSDKKISPTCRRDELSYGKPHITFLEPESPLAQIPPEPRTHSPAPANNTPSDFPRATSSDDLRSRELLRLEQSRR
jgi:hypothetical protein